MQLIKRTLDADESLRDLALFSTATDTMLRSVDVLRLTVEDVTDDAGHVVDEITIRQQKTGESNVVGVSDYTCKVLGRWIIESKKLPEDYLFTRVKGDRRKPLTRDHYPSWSSAGLVLHVPIRAPSARIRCGGRKRRISTSRPASPPLGSRRAS